MTLQLSGTFRVDGTARHDSPGHTEWDEEKAAQPLFKQGMRAVQEGRMIVQQPKDCCCQRHARKNKICLTIPS